ncbi:hypothetical protein JHK87_027279 [Glycine soja]|nr:hypothetical protein JHK87_027279 [Glycine soja]
MNLQDSEFECNSGMITISTSSSENNFNGKDSLMEEIDYVQSYEELLRVPYFAIPNVLLIEVSKCCGSCGRVLEDYFFTEEPSFVKNVAGQVMEA